MLQVRHDPLIAERLAAARQLASDCRTAELDELLAGLRADIAGSAGGELAADLEIEFAVLKASDLWNREHLDEAQGELDRVSGLVPDAGATAQGRHYAMAAIIAVMRGAADVAVDHAVKAVAAVEDEQPSMELAMTLGQCALAFSQAQLFPLSIVVIEDAIAAATTVGQPTARFRTQAAHIQLTWGMRQDHLGITTDSEQRWKEVVRHYEAAMAEEHTLPELFVRLAHAERALVAARMDDPAGARRFHTKAGEPTTHQTPTLRRVLAHAEGAVLLAEGRYAEARAVLAALWHSVRKHRVPARTEDVPLLLARTAEAEGHWEEALRWYREVYTRYGRVQYAMWESRATAARLQLEQEALLRRTRQLETDALSDPLTGVPNRRAFDTNLPRLISHAHTTGTPLTLAIIDVDHFKTVNDNHGHPVGDEVLRRIATILRTSSRDADHCARYGGDEFVLCLPTPATDAATALDRITHTIATHPWPTISPGLTITITTGTAELSYADTPTTLFWTADQHLLTNKRARPPLHATTEPAEIPMARPTAP